MANEGVFSRSRSAVRCGLLFLSWLAVAWILVLPRASQAQTFTTLYTFTGNTDGGAPSGLIEGKNSVFYGTSGGDALGSGTVFSITPQGKLTTLYTFTVGTDGAYPNGLMQGKDGNLYGTTQGGGAVADGTVFKVTTAGTLTSLYSFSGVATDGAAPHAGVIQGKDGNFYGTTLSGGGAENGGTVFRITAGGALTKFAGSARVVASVRRHNAQGEDMGSQNAQ